jgi:N-ATPase, AtpR subunit
MEVDAPAMTATLVAAFLWPAFGMLVGMLYWLTLRWSVARLAAGRSIALPIALQLLRFAALGAVLAFVASRSGWAALLLSTAGLMLARAVALRPLGRG